MHQLVKLGKRERKEYSRYNKYSKSMTETVKEIFKFLLQHLWSISHLGWTLRKIHWLNGIDLHLENVILIHPIHEYILKHFSCCFQAKKNRLLLVFNVNISYFNIESSTFVQLKTLCENKVSFTLKKLNKDINIYQILLN